MTPSSQLMRIFFDDQTVFKRSRFAFVGIDAEINGLARILGHEAPFHPRGKTRSAATAQAGQLHNIDDFCGLVFPKGFGCAFVSTQRFVDPDLLKVSHVHIFRQYLCRHGKTVILIK